MAMIQGIDGSALLAAFRQGRSDRATDDKAQAEKARTEQIGGLIGQLFPGQTGGGVAGNYAPSQPAKRPTVADAFNPQAMTQIGAMDAGGAAPGPVVAPQAGVHGYQSVSSPSDRAQWAKRNDGSDKGMGFLGLLRRPDGGVSSEISAGITIDGKQIEVPLMVPGLTKPELDYLMTHEPDLKKNPRFFADMPPSILQKAGDHARDRLSAGLDPFAQEGEQAGAGQQTQPAPQAPTQRMAAPDPNILAKLTVLDPDTGAKLASAFKTMADTDLQHHQTRNDMLGAAAHFLERYPPEQRHHMMEIVAPQLLQAGWTPQEIEQADLSDNGLKGYQAVAIDFDKMIDNERAERELNMPKVVTPQPGAGAFAYSPGTGKIDTIVAPNDGTHSTGAPVGTGAVTKTIGGVTYYQTPDGKWHDEPQGGGAGNGTGGFPG